MDSFYALDVLPKVSPRLEMSYKGFKASLKKARRLEGNFDHNLPSGVSVPVYPIDMLPGSPEKWIRGPGSYVCPVDKEWGLWFDWTANDSVNTAILPSVKGSNPITGKKLEGLILEKYEEKCPIHNIPFMGDKLFCKECGYSWPPQNYVSYPNILWWDGWRSPDGKVRQFFISDDEERDIASALIGKENTVPAFGFAFYRPKKERIKETETKTSFYPSWGTYTYSYPFLCDFTERTLGPKEYFSGSLESFDITCNSTRGCSSGASNVPKYRTKTDKKQNRINKQSVSIGAGASIKQELSPDTLSVKDWKDEPSAIIRLYFVFEEQFREIAKHGISDIEGNKNGFLDGLPVG